VRIRFILSRALIAASLAFLLLALGFGIHTELFLRSAKVSSARVIQFHTITDDQNGGVAYAPIFSFSASDGRIYTITSSVGANPPAFSIGQAVTILYDKANPANAKIDSVGQLWFFSIFFGIMGSSMALAAFVLIRFESPRSREPVQTTV
jgi:hypothetical protein